MSIPWTRVPRVVPMFLALVWGCSTPAPESGHEGRAPDPGRVVREPGSRTGGEPLLVADVQTLLMAHRIAPGESLAVRLLGIVGPNGSYALESVDVEHEPGRVVLRPRVRRIPGDFFTQALIPLDWTTRFPLPLGSCVVEVQDAQRTRTDTVQVEAGVVRTPPRTEVVSVLTTSLGVVRIEIQAHPGDGFIDRVELREWSANEPGSWRPAESSERKGAGLRAWASVRRPEADPERRLEFRSIDGQGQTDRAPTEQILAPLTP